MQEINAMTTSVKKASQYEIPIDEITESELSDGRHGVSIVSTVRETLNLLGDKDKQILYLYFWGRASASRNCQTTEHSCWNRKKQTSHGKTKFQNPISI